MAIRCRYRSNTRWSQDEIRLLPLLPVLETERSNPFGPPRYPDLVLSTGLACVGLGGISRSHTPRTMARMAGELTDAAVAVLLWGFPVEVALLVQAAPARLPLPPSRPAGRDLPPA